ncbi:hypothetical protein GGS21DRAFT_264842 [Xylaria nigripes]|nr:hypothetical protein GGS21DRAFT_264842 [Xylaria nigripes]
MDSPCADPGSLGSPPSPSARMGPFASVRRFVPPVGTEIVTARPVDGMAPPPEVPVARPKQKRAPVLNREQRIEIRTLRVRAKWSYERIATELGCTQKQVQKACTEPLTPKKRRGKVAIDSPQRERIKDWLEEDPARLKIAWRDLPAAIPDFPYYGEAAINTAMKTLGYTRRDGRTRRAPRSKAALAKAAQAAQAEMPMNNGLLFAPLSAPVSAPMSAPMPGHAVEPQLTSECLTISGAQEYQGDQDEQDEQDEHDEHDGQNDQNDQSDHPDQNDQDDRNDQNNRNSRGDQDDQHDQDLTI